MKLDLLIKLILGVILVLFSYLLVKLFTGVLVLFVLIAIIFWYLFLT